MDASDPHALSSMLPDVQADAIAGAGVTKPRERRRLQCDDVARNRAARYARRRRIPKPVWPVIAALMLVALISERYVLPVFWRTRRRPLMDGEGATRQPTLDDGPGLVGFADPSDTGGAIRGEGKPQYRPPERFLAKDAAQVVAFLIRNRGRLDNEAVRAKWDIIDRISLPLAVYLREIEATAAWDDLEKEISAAPPGSPAVSPAEIPKSQHHRKILRLLPEWSRRGEEFLSSVPAGDSTRTPIPDGGDEPDTEPPKP
ncbi:hypothetical protein [Mesorhizobium sp. Root695]|uniref:hypothetical protein n=1 Tax=Mesorhizobium sp. Root695 TaxID=1736589 RepID=UPI000AD983EC|nr:hypothetical protein [Mesorhizobium sp. Root695]